MYTGTSRACAAPGTQALGRRSASETELSTRGFSGNRSNDRGQAGLTDGGRCAHSPDAYQRRQVETLAGYGVPETEIASLIGIDPKTLRRHYRQELDHGHTNPLRRMALLARHLLILIQPMIDGRNERI